MLISNVFRASSSISGPRVFAGKPPMPYHAFRAEATSTKLLPVRSTTALSNSIFNSQRNNDHPSFTETHRRLLSSLKSHSNSDPKSLTAQALMSQEAFQSWRRYPNSFLKSLKVMRLTDFITLGSMAASTGVYAVFFTWPFATGVVCQVMVHEIGHVLAAIHWRVPFGPIFFVLDGAGVPILRRPKNAWDDAMLRFGGPALGGLSATGLALVASGTGSQLLHDLATAGLLLNVMNLLPIDNSDGAHIARAISPYTGVAVWGSLGVIAACCYPTITNLLCATLGGGYEVYNRFCLTERKPSSWFKMTDAQRALLVCGYVGLAGALVLVLHFHCDGGDPFDCWRGYGRCLFFAYPEPLDMEAFCKKLDWWEDP